MWQNFNKVMAKTGIFTFFHTTMDSLSGAEKAYNEIKAKFPNPEYSVTLTVWEKSGREVDGDEFFARMHSN